MLIRFRVLKTFRNFVADNILVFFSMESYFENLICHVSRHLRAGLKESYYRTSKECGLRPETIKKLESAPMSGSADALCIYLDSFCKRFPQVAYRLLYGTILNVTQSKIEFDS